MNLSNALGAAIPFFLFVILTGCYHGAGNEDPEETSPIGIIPWGVQLLPGQTSDASGISYVTRRDQCCGLAALAHFAIPKLHGAHSIYFDIRVPVAGRRISVTFSNGKSVATGPMDAGAQTVRIAVPADAVNSKGVAEVRISILTTPPDVVSLSNGPTEMTLLGITRDLDIEQTAGTLPGVVEAK